jgi:hypothetical protein
MELSSIDIEEREGGKIMRSDSAVFGPYLLCAYTITVRDLDWESDCRYIVTVCKWKAAHRHHMYAGQLLFGGMAV